MSQLSRLIPTSGPGSGTVTSIAAGTGITLTPNPITTTGTVALTVPVAIANGGTNAITFATTDGTVYYDGTRLVTTATGSAGQVLTSNGVGLAPTYQNAASGVTSITGNTGGAQTGAITLITANATPIFAGVAGTITLDFNKSNLILGNNGSTITIGAANDGFGAGVLQNITSGTSNSAFGNASLQNIVGGSQNSSYGASSGAALTSGGNSTLIGFQSGLLLQSGNSNVALGYQSGSAWGAAVSNNIAIGTVGAVADSARIRIGTNGVHTTFFAAGIDGVNVGSVAKVLTMASDQLGTATITAGTGITVTPGANTITIAATGTTTLTYTNVNTTPYVVLTTDEYLSVDCSGGPITLQFPNAATLGRVFIVKDRTGSANTNAITVTTVGGAVNIDGATTYAMNTQYAAINLIGNGSSYEIY